MKVIIKLHTITGDIGLEEAINSHTIQSWKSYIYGEVRNTLSSVPINGAALKMIYNEIREGNEVFIIALPAHQYYIDKLLDYFRSEFGHTLISAMVGDNYDKLVQTVTGGEPYHYIGLGLSDYNNFSKANRISINTNVISYMALYLLFFYKIQFAHNTYLNGMLSMLFYFTHIFSSLFVFLPVCFNFISTDKAFYILPMFKSVFFSLFCASLLANLRNIDEDRNKLYYYSLEPLCDLGFITQNYSLYIALFYILLSGFLSILPVKDSMIATLCGCLVGIAHYYLYYKNHLTRILCIGLLLIIINALFFAYITILQ